MAVAEEGGGACSGCAVLVLSLGPLSSLWSYLMSDRNRSTHQGAPYHKLSPLYWLSVPLKKLRPSPPRLSHSAPLWPGWRTSVLSIDHTSRQPFRPGFHLPRDVPRGAELTSQTPGPSQYNSQPKTYYSTLRTATRIVALTLEAVFLAWAPLLRSLEGRLPPPSICGGYLRREVAPGPRTSGMQHRTIPSTQPSGGNLCSRQFPSSHRSRGAQMPSLCGPTFQINPPNHGAIPSDEAQYMLPHVNRKTRIEDKPGTTATCYMIPFL